MPSQMNRSVCHHHTKNYIEKKKCALSFIKILEKLVLKHNMMHWLLERIP
jgi:hypothetical protein